jgi:hypothetical protein
MASEDIHAALAKAVAHYWNTREQQRVRQSQKGRLDQGARAAATGGAQMDGFISLFRDLILGAGGRQDDIYFKRRLELP